MSTLRGWPQSSECCCWWMTWKVHWSLRQLPEEISKTLREECSSKWTTTQTRSLPSCGTCSSDSSPETALRSPFRHPRQCGRLQDAQMRFFQECSTECLVDILRPWVIIYYKPSINQNTTKLHMSGLHRVTAPLSLSQISCFLLVAIFVLRNSDLLHSGIDKSNVQGKATSCCRCSLLLHCMQSK